MSVMFEPWGGAEVQAETGSNPLPAFSKTEKEPGQTFLNVKNRLLFQCLLCVALKRIYWLPGIPKQL